MVLSGWDVRVVNRAEIGKRQHPAFSAESQTMWTSARDRHWINILCNICDTLYICTGMCEIFHDYGSPVIMTPEVYIDRGDTEVS